MQSNGKIRWQVIFVLSFVATATKDEDELGIATPDLVIQGDDPLVVYGEGFMGQYSPLSRANLEEKLKMEYVSKHFSKGPNFSIMHLLFLVVD